jgi:AraC-like DNA-binding protein
VCHDVAGRPALARGGRVPAVGGDGVDDGEQRLRCGGVGGGDERGVDQLCAGTGLSERALQRLVSRRLGLTPKWLVQRRRLQEAAGRLRERTTTVAEVAAAPGYADQPHLTRDFARVTGMTPGGFAARYGLPPTRWTGGVEVVRTAGILLGARHTAGVRRGSVPTLPGS